MTGIESVRGELGLVRVRVRRQHYNWLAANGLLYCCFCYQLSLSLLLLLSGFGFQFLVKVIFHARSPVVI